MRVLDKRSRDRLALFYAILAFNSLLLGVIAGALSPRDALPWIYPIAGLVGYVIFAQRAMRLWRRGSTPPARSRTYRWGLTASALMLAAPGPRRSRRFSRTETRKETRHSWSRVHVLRRPRERKPDMLLLAMMILLGLLTFWAMLGFVRFCEKV
jgi:hypothetical protein